MMNTKATSFFIFFWGIGKKEMLQLVNGDVST
jgi:hypothetical protein